VTPLVPLFDFIPVLSYAATPEACPSTCTDFGWEIYPQGLREVLTFAGTLGLPIAITENGLADAADAKRARYLYDHLRVLQSVVADGVADVRGYYHWSLTDNFEWASGYIPKFGAYAFDPATGKRTLRQGARVLRDVAKANGLTPKLTKRVAPGS
jgi:beta-glucosidase/6-phospho-beta-glucosidase/beta-galactosidase